MKKFIDDLTDLITRSIVKILKVDLNTDVYEIIKLTEIEPTVPSPYLKDWIDDFIDKEYVHIDDAEMLRVVVNSTFIKRSLKHKSYIHMKMKRRYREGAEYRTNIITILPVKEEKDKAYIIVYDMYGI